MFNKRFHDKTNAWPGFVDVFSNLVIILIFLLIVFLFLWTTTSIFNKNTGVVKVAELEQTQQEQAERIEEMTADKQEAEQLLLAARDALITQETQIENQRTQTENLANAYESQMATLTAEQEKLATQIAALTEQLQLAKTEKQNVSEQLQIANADNQKMSEQLKTLIEQQSIVAKNTAENKQDILDQANTEINELNSKIAELESALKASESAAKQKEVEYAEMSNRLNKALAEKVAELNSLAQYQSEFYKQIKIALGNRTSIQPDGDRFIVSSDILFPSGSYKITPDGKKQLKLLANVIKDFEMKIPTNIDWIIRVDGHTDNADVIPGTHGYKNNMELSLLRATAVVNELVHDGVSKRRLVPSGFGQLHPVALGRDGESMQKNRRIELQLTNK